MKDFDALESLSDLLATPELPAIGPQPRSRREISSSLNKKLDEIFRKASVDAETQRLIRSLVLLWHDHLDESHTISQEIHTPNGSFLHGIMHRREPDYWNSKYWFRRVGQHAVFPAIGERVTELLSEAGEKSLLQQLAGKQQWDAFAFVDACEQAAQGKLDQNQIWLLQKIQEIESRALLAHFLNR